MLLTRYYSKNFTNIGLILITCLENKPYYYSHFTDEKIEAKEVKLR